MPSGRVATGVPAALDALAASVPEDGFRSPEQAHAATTRAATAGTERREAPSALTMTAGKLASGRVAAPRDPTLRRLAPSRAGCVAYMASIGRRCATQGGNKSLSEIIIHEDENFERALKRFKKKCEKAGILSDLRKHRHYEKPSERRKRKLNAAMRKNRRTRSV